MFEDETPVAWTVMPRHAAVVGTDGSELGTAESALGDEAEDIFHGIVLRRDGRLFDVPAAHIKKITALHVITDLTESDTQTLQPYRQT